MLLQENSNFDIDEFRQKSEFALRKKKTAFKKR